MLIVFSKVETYNNPNEIYLVSTRRSMIITSSITFERLATDCQKLFGTRR